MSSITKSLAIFSFISLTLTGCAPKVDGTDFNAYLRSTEKMCSKLPRPECEQLHWDVANIQTHAMVNKGDMLKEINGMTAQEIHARAEKYKQELKQEEDQREAERLAKKKLGEKAAAEEKVIVEMFDGKINSAKVMHVINYDNFYYDTTVEVDVKNGTPFPVAGFGYILTLLSETGEPEFPSPSAHTFDSPLLSGESRHISIKNRLGLNADKSKIAPLASQLEDFLERNRGDKLTANRETSFSATFKITDIDTGDGKHFSINKIY